jgi:hypothetical protein
MVIVVCLRAVSEYETVDHKRKTRYGKMKCSRPDYVHKYKITDMVTCSVRKESTIVEQRNAGDVITRKEEEEEEVIEGE